MIDKIINDLQEYQFDCIDALRMECSPSDIKTNPEAKKLAKHLNRQNKIIIKVIKLLKKIEE